MSEVDRGVQLIEKMITGLSFLPMGWQEVFKPELVQEIEEFLARYSPNDVWRDYADEEE